MFTCQYQGYVCQLEYAYIRVFESGAVSRTIGLFPKGVKDEDSLELQKKCN